MLYPLSYGGSSAGGPTGVCPQRLPGAPGAPAGELAFAP